MGLSDDLISQFAKITKDDTKPKSETTVYGTTVEYNGAIYVKLDGSDRLTPVITTADLKTDERVSVMIKNHAATVTGNITSPSASKSDLDDAVDQITEVEILVANKVSTEELDAQIGRIDSLVSDNVTIKETLSATEAIVETLTADNVTIKGQLTAAEANIENLTTTKLDTEIAKATYAEIGDLEVVNADIHNLEADYGAFKDLSTDKFTAIEGDIGTLETDKLSTTDAELKYANIDFANIGSAAIEQFFSKSGMIDDLVVGEGTIAGTLVGVTIIGDLIEGGTVKADKLVVLGEDGLYYKLNTDGVTTSTEQTEYNSLNGSIITAKSITAEKISVKDLVAFGATIGGFHITDTSIYSGVKEAIDNTTNGLYLGSDGQMVFGNGSNFVKFFVDADGSYKLVISADAISFGSSQTDVETVIDNVRTIVDEAKASADDASSRVENSEARLDIVATQISTILVDENGETAMYQDETGWHFNITKIINDLSKTSEELSNLSGDVDGIDSVVSELDKLMESVTEKTAYINMIEDENGDPCIELGKTDNEFRVRITNTAVNFLQGNDNIAWVNNKSLNIDKAVIENDLQIGEGTGFIWRKRANGNMGLRWVSGE